MLPFAFTAPDGFVPSKPSLECSNVAEEWIVVRNRDILLPTSEARTLPRQRPAVELQIVQQVGRWSGVSIMAGAVTSDTQAPSGWCWVGLRALYGVLEDSRLSLAGRAVQMLDWELCHAFCGRCGAQTDLVQGEHCRRCKRCGLTAFPRIEPAVIVAITRPPGEILLARSSRLPAGMHSVLAGFVEPGETLEQCAEREVFEESGIRIKNLQYVASQPWPFPRSLMLGFVAEYASGELKVDQQELESAAWFRFDQLPQLPSQISIARALIEFVRTRDGQHRA